MSTSSDRTVLVVGGTGLVGSAAVSEFLARGWTVATLSRRTPEAPGRRPLRALVADLRDRDGVARALRELPVVTHLVYAALHETPELMSGWTEREQQETNLAMFANVVDPVAARGALEHVSLLQGAKAYGAHLHPIRVPSREREPRDDHPNFYWLQEDHLAMRRAEHGFGSTILRPQLIIGDATGVAMNPLIAIGMYLAIRARLGEPAGFPGGACDVWQMTDAALLAESLAWAAETPAARNQTFNVTNGDEFHWRDLWPAVVEMAGARQGPDDPTSVRDYLLDHRAVWAEMVREHGLVDEPMETVLAQSAIYADHCMGYGRSDSAYPRLLSTIAIRQAGFAACRDTEDSVRYWLERLVSRRRLPRPRGVGAAAPGR